MKALWTLNVDGYAPEITDLTYPFLRRYAEKCGMEFRIISERKWPEMPAVFEKLQLFELGEAYDWNLYVDSDCLVHPDFIDLTEQVPKDTVVHYGHDFRPNRFRGDKYFYRDGRNIGACNWFTLASNWCLDLWNPPNPFEKFEKDIYPTTNERTFGMDPLHLIDDYILSRNIARFGLKVKTVHEVLGKFDAEYCWHEYASSIKDKVLHAKRMLYAWGLGREAGLPDPPTPPEG